MSRVGGSLSSPDPYQEISDYAKGGRPDLQIAWAKVNKMLVEDPMDARALIGASFIMRRLENLPAAFHYGKASTQIWPHSMAAWLNLGHAAGEMWLTEYAEHCYQKALKYAKSEDEQKDVWLNLSALYLDNGKFQEAEAITRTILEHDPNHEKSQGNLGFCLLARRDWSGWKGYHKNIGTDWRPKVVYGDEPEWDGTHGKTVAIYGDQGLGDEISFASVLPDAIAVCKKLILDCDERLAGLFRRSFPQAKVYGTRRAKDGQWAKADRHVDASLPLGQLGEFFRLSDGDFPRTPYLISCPIRTAGWESVFKRLRKPVIGIAWTGGIPKTNSRNRKIALDDFLPVFDTIDAHFVSLQYKDAAQEIAAFRASHPHVDLVQYPWATLTNDYDDTAALIAACDAVICIQTAVAHTAGGLGIPVTVLVPKATTWRYGQVGDSIPWYESLRVIRQETHGKWSSEIERAARELQAYFSTVPGDAGAIARKRLRGNGIPVLGSHLPDHQYDGGHAPS